MATEQSSSETTPVKRQRRLKQDSQFVFENSTIDETETDTTPNSNKRSSINNKAKPVRFVDDNTASADLYEPGDIVWSKLGSFPWWPALIYRCDAEGGIYTKTLNSNNKSKRQYFIYFYGKYLEYSWLSTRSLLKYAGLTNFIQHAEAAVQQASTKSEQLELANRFQLKVSMKKRVQWDEAIELADRALTMTKTERIKQFSDLLKGARDNKNQSKNSLRRRNASVDKNQDDETVPNKRRARASSSSSFSAKALDETIGVEKSTQSVPNQNGSTLSDDNKKVDEQPVKKKRGRKPKSESQVNEKTNDTSNLSTSSMRTRTTQLISSSNKKKASSSPTRTSQRTLKTSNDSEIEYEYVPSSNNQPISAPVIHLIQSNIPPLSNYEQKQIVEGLLNHNKEKILTFDEAQTFAINKAIEIVFANYNYQMNHLSPEWFYDSILLKYPSIVFKYRSWFEDVQPDVIPNGTDMIELKQWQIALMLQAHIKAEQQQSSNEN